MKARDDGISGNGTDVVASRVIRRVEPCTRLRSECSQHLPDELIEEILGSLDDMADRVKFSAVCKRWCSTLRSPILPRVRLPWLLLGSHQDETIQFCSISSNKTYSIHHNLNRSHNNLTIATSDSGWLLVCGHEYRYTIPPLCFFLFNPISGAQISLPKFPDDHPYFIQTTIVSPGDKCLVVMMTCNNKWLLCYRLLKSVEKPTEWTMISIKDVLGDEECTCRFTYYRGHYFILGAKYCSTYIVDSYTNELVSVMPLLAEVICEHGWQRYLVQSSSGDELFLVIMHSRYSRTRFDVLQWDSTEKQIGWSKVKSIGSDTWFRSRRVVMAIPAANYSCTFIRENCIIFLDGEDGQFTRLCLFDIGNDSVEQLPCALDCLTDYYGTDWFVPVL